MERHRIGIVIPALNEAATIASVVSKAYQYGVPIVVDDGSSDKTGELAAVAGATVVRHDANRGYDQALNSGFVRADELGCEYVVTMDADGQHDPVTLVSFIHLLEKGADVVIGTRNHHQRLAEHIFAWAASVKWGIHDPLCGMKAYRIDIYKELGHFDSYNSIGTELALYAAKTGKNIVQLPVKIHERIDTPRFGRRCSSNVRILRSLLKGIYPMDNHSANDPKDPKGIAFNQDAAHFFSKRAKQPVFIILPRKAFVKLRITGIGMNQ